MLNEVKHLGMRDERNPWPSLALHFVQDDNAFAVIMGWVPNPRVGIRSDAWLRTYGSMDGIAGYTVVQPQIITAISNETCSKEQSPQLAQLDPEAARLEIPAAAPAVMTSVYQTLKPRGANPLETIVAAMTQYMKASQLPPIPH